MIARDLSEDLESLVCQLLMVFFFGGGTGSRIELQEKLKERGYDAR